MFIITIIWAGSEIVFVLVATCNHQLSKKPGSNAFSVSVSGRPQAEANDAQAKLLLPLIAFLFFICLPQTDADKRGQPLNFEYIFFCSRHRLLFSIQLVFSRFWHYSSTHHCWHLARVGFVAYFYWESYAKRRLPPRGRSQVGQEKKRCGGSVFLSSPLLVFFLSVLAYGVCFMWRLPIRAFEQRALWLSVINEITLLLSGISCCCLSITLGLCLCPVYVLACRACFWLKSLSALGFYFSRFTFRNVYMCVCGSIQPSQLVSWLAGQQWSCTTTFAR